MIVHKIKKGRLRQQRIRCIQECLVQKSNPIPLIIDHGVDHTIDYGVDHTIDYGVDYSIDYGVDYSIDYGVDYSINGVIDG